nr:peptide chain release factor N(5)-glutamine methyltransferase [Clostridium sp. AF37-5AT]
MCEFKIWADVLNYGKKILKNAGIVEADLDAWYLFEQSFGISRAQYFLCARENIVGSTAQKIAVQEQHGDLLESGNALECAELWLKEKLSVYESALKKRVARIPLQQIIGRQEFMGLTFFVNEHVLIPRQDTETLVELVLQEQKDKDISILDMCTGSGCIAVSLKKLGGYAHVEGADISEEALKVARKNAAEILKKHPETLTDAFEQNKAVPEENCLMASGHQKQYDDSEQCMMLNAGVSFRHSDMFSAFPETEPFDVIVSNPPYIPSAVIEELEPEVRDHEPRGALDGTADGLYFYRILAEECAKHLTPGGHVYFEIGYDQGMAVKELLDNHGFKDTRVIQDLAGKDRVVCGAWQTAGV